MSDTPVERFTLNCGFCQRPTILADRHCIHCENAELRSQVEALTKERDKWIDESAGWMGIASERMAKISGLERQLASTEGARALYSAEVDALKKERDEMAHELVVAKRWKSISENAVASLAAYRDDTERYRWIRDCIDTTYDPETGETFVRFDPLLGFNAWIGAKDERAIDVLIDAARGEKP